MKLFPNSYRLRVSALWIFIAGAGLLAVSPTYGSAALASYDTADSTIDVDGDGSADALTDGLLLLRYMFGLSGNSLITGVVSENAAYKTPDELIGRMSNLGNKLDVDSNGEIDALTDGLIILRYLFGLDGEALIANVIGEDADRPSAGDIQTYLQQLALPASEDSGQPNII